MPSEWLTRALMLPRAVVISVFYLSLVTGVDLHANTTITFSRDEIANMANLWETDCVSISPVATAQYPSFPGNWDFIVPHTTISSDGDIHIDMAVDASGTGSTGNNTGASPIVCEVINSSSSQLSHLTALKNHQASFRGIFRFYTEHSGERHFELHPVTQLQTWDGTAFIPDSDYHGNLIADPDGTTHSPTTLTAVFDGSYTMTATASADNTSITFNFPSPSVNYCQYDGVALSGLQSDAPGNMESGSARTPKGKLVRPAQISEPKLYLMSVEPIGTA
jgi:hypothetical protein